MSYYEVAMGSLSPPHGSGDRTYIAVHLALMQRIYTMYKRKVIDNIIASSDAMLKSCRVSVVQCMVTAKLPTRITSSCDC